MTIDDFCSDLYNHVFAAIDAEDENFSECGVGGYRAGEIATKIAELAKALLNDIACL